MRLLVSAREVLGGRGREVHELGQHGVGLLGASLSQACATTPRTPQELPPVHSEIAHTLGRARRRAAPRRSTTTPCGRSGGGGSRGAGRGCACRRCARVEHLLSAAPQECRELTYVRVTDTHAVLPHSAEERATVLAALLLADEKDRLAQQVSPRRHTRTRRSARQRVRSGTYWSGACRARAMSARCAR